MDLNKESLRKACIEGGESMEEMVRLVQFIMVGAYLDQDSDKYSEEECSAIMCPRCGELSFYSAKVMLPGFPYDRLCLAPPCVEAALREMFST